MDNKFKKSVVGAYSKISKISKLVTIITISTISIVGTIEDSFSADMPECMKGNCECIKDDLNKIGYSKEGEKLSHHIKGYFLITNRGYVLFVKNDDASFPKVYSVSFYDEDAEKEAIDFVNAKDKEIDEDRERRARRDGRLQTLLNNITGKEINPYQNNIELVGDIEGNKINAIYGIEIK